jgi:aarF domain-containing kinase
MATGKVEENLSPIAKDLRSVMEKLGPTYVKMGQMLSIRPDIVADEIMKELKTLQDGVKMFPTSEALQVIKLEYGIDDISDVFLELSEEPVAAASLAQVYKGRLLDGTDVAVKVQRPGTLELVSKDLYVIRRATELIQGIVERFNPTDKTDYIALMETWGEGFYTELDFVNEAMN